MDCATHYTKRRTTLAFHNVVHRSTSFWQRRLGLDRSKPMPWLCALKKPTTTAGPFWGRMDTLPPMGTCPVAGMPLFGCCLGSQKVQASQAVNCLRN